MGGVEHLRGGGGERRWVALMVVSLGLAVLCRQLDVAGRFSGPDDWWQGHCAWHLLCAVSLGTAYLDQRSESVRTRVTDVGGQPRQPVDDQVSA